MKIVDMNETRQTYQSFLDFYHNVKIDTNKLVAQKSQNAKLKTIMSNSSNNRITQTSKVYNKGNAAVSRKLINQSACDQLTNHKGFESANDAYNLEFT